MGMAVELIESGKVQLVINSTWKGPRADEPISEN